MMSWPSAIGLRSTSIGAPAAIVEASGFIWETSGQTVARPPTAAAAPVATKRKSRREPAEDAVVTIPNPFSAAAGGTAPGNAHTTRRGLPAPATPGGACNALNPPRAAIYSEISWRAGSRASTLVRLRHPGPLPNADRTFPARYPAEHRHDSASVRLPGRGSPHHRARGISGVRPAFPPGRNGLSRSGDDHAPRFVVKIPAMA